MLSADAQKILQAVMNAAGNVRRRHDNDTSDYNLGVDAAVSTILRAAQLAAGAGTTAQALVARAMPYVDSAQTKQPNAIDRLRLRQALRRI